MRNAHTHLLQEFLDMAVDVGVREVELGDDATSFWVNRHRV